MNRRVFIEKTLVAGSFLFGGALSGMGCSRDIRRRYPVPASTEKQGAGIGPDEWQILYYASLAPSGHNSQPWFVRVEGPGEWVVGVDSDRQLRVVDPDNREALLSIGAFLENLVLASGYFGYDSTLEVIASTRSDTDLVRVRLAKGKPTNITLDSLESRRTLKTGMLTREIRGQDVDDFKSAAGNGVHYFPRESSHARCMTDAAVENFRRQFENKAAVAEMARWTRLSDSDAARLRDGLTTDGMEINGITGWIVRHFMGPEDVKGPSWREKAVEKAAVQAGQGGGWMVITSNGTGIPDIIDAGRRFQRMALIARKKNIAIHPMTQVLEEIHGQNSIRKNHGPAMVPQFMLRVGYVNSYPDPVSLRRPVGWFLG